MAIPSEIRLQRLRLGLPISRLALVSGVSATRLSLAERGLTTLSDVEERARGAALERLAVLEGISR